MKKVVIFLHGELRGAQDFGPQMIIHRDYQKWSQRQIDWQLITGHLDPRDNGFLTLIKPILQADVFVCDADNSNNQAEDNCFTRQEKLHQALKKIKKLNPRIKIFIKTWPYIEEAEEQKLAKLGKIIPEWFWESVIKSLKK